MRRGIRDKIKTYPKWALVPVIAALLLSGGITLAAIGITSPTSLSYQAPPGSTTMQSFTAADCEAMGTYTTVTLSDNRDGTSYNVRKMPDAHCWMIDNLKLAGGTSLTAANTNLDGTQAAYFATAWNSISAPVQNAATRSTNGICLSPNGTALGTTSGTGTYLTCNGTGAQSAFNTPYVAYTNPAGTENSTMYENCTAGTYSGTSNNSLTGCGYIYNWYTATAGSGSYAPSSGSVTASICPSGWRLPYNTATNDFGVLNNAMATGAAGSSTANGAANYPNWLYNGPFQGSLSGYYYANFGAQGLEGHYWSAGASSNTHATFLYFRPSGVDPGNVGYYKYYGMAVRCML